MGEMTGELPVVPLDRRCRPRSLDNGLRRWLAPGRRELDALALAPGLTVADLGCGVGFLLPGIGDRIGPAGRLWAIDPDPDNLELARRRHVRAPTEFRVASAASVPEIAPASVDRVLLSLVLCCAADKAGILDEAWRILRAGGRLLATYPRLRVPGPRSRVALRMSEGRWEALRARHPWRERPAYRSWLVRAHLLEVPAEPGRPPAS